MLIIRIEEELHENQVVSTLQLQVRFIKRRFALLLFIQTTVLNIMEYILLRNIQLA